MMRHFAMRRQRHHVAAKSDVAEKLNPRSWRPAPTDGVWRCFGGFCGVCCITRVTLAELRGRCRCFGVLRTSRKSLVQHVEEIARWSGADGPDLLWVADERGSRSLGLGKVCVKSITGLTLSLLFGTLRMPER